MLWSFGFTSVGRLLLAECRFQSVDLGAQLVDLRLLQPALAVDEVLQHLHLVVLVLSNTQLLTQI